jgi:hypothetical protein
LRLGPRIRGHNSFLRAGCAAYGALGVDACPHCMMRYGSSGKLGENMTIASRLNEALADVATRAVIVAACKSPIPYSD